MSNPIESSENHPDHGLQHRGHDRHGARVESTAPSTADVAMLRWSAAAFELAQGARLRVGEQIRAVIQGRDDKWPADGDAPAVAWAAADPDHVLTEIRMGRALGPVAVLGHAYRRHWAEEREMLRLMEISVARHPAWPWLGRVRGIGPTLGARLLSRLRAERAPTPSSFWAYCGLATVPGLVYGCDVCGARLTWAADRRPPASHRRPRARETCDGALRPLPSPDGSLRVAQPRPARGDAARYDRVAKTVCYLAAVSFLRTGGAYGAVYHARRARLDEAHADWPAKRRHLTALRATEKLFLAHLWVVWREAIGLPTTMPYVHAHLGAESVISPWSMVDA